MRISDWSSDVCSSDLLAPSDQPVGECRILVGEQRGGEEGGVGRARLADREGRHRNSAGQLDERIEAVDADQGRRLDGNAEYRNAGQRREHAGQESGRASSRERVRTYVKI